MARRSSRSSFRLGCILAISALSALSAISVINPVSAIAQTTKLPPGGVRLDKSETQKWQVGLTITAPQNGLCVGIYGTATVPSDWPEQQVKLVDRRVTPGVQIKFRTLPGGVKQMQMQARRLAPGQTAEALLTFEVTKHTLAGPEDTSVFQQPRRIDRVTRQYLAPSPLIESNHNQIANQARALVKEIPPENGWERVERIYDWVREHVEYREGPIKGALAAMNDKTGDCEELTSLFIAMCRAVKIPARTVWIPGHCYPEFYLEDAQGQGHWFPCQAAGDREFGSISDAKPILQKGDNFRVPEKRERQRYVAEFVKVQNVRGGGQPTVVVTRKLLEEL